MAIAILQSRSVYVLVLSKSGQSDDMGRLARAPVGVRFPSARVCYTQRNLAAHSSESMTTTMPHCQMVTPIIRPCSPSSCPSERADHSENVIGFLWVV